MSDRDDCLRCGACCFSRLEQYVPVTPEDLQRLGDAAGELVRHDGNSAYMRMEAGHCAALVVDRQSGQFFCRAYLNRPQVCRELERGSAQCSGEYLAKRHRARSAMHAG